MASPHDRFTYPDELAQYSLHNFFPREMVDRVVAAITGQDRVIDLVGPLGSGRGYLLHAAAFEARRRGLSVRVAPVDLTGFEDETPLSRYVQFLSQTIADPAKSSLAAEVAREVKASPAEVEFPAVVGFNFGLTVEIPAQKLAAWLLGCPDRRTAGPRRAAREHLRELIAAHVPDGGRVVLWFPRAIALDCASRRALLDELAVNPKLVLAFGYETPPTTVLRTPRVTLPDWNEDEMKARIRERYRPSAFPADFYRVLWDCSASAPMHAASSPGRTREGLASVMVRLMQSSALTQEKDGVWSLPLRWSTDSAVVDALLVDGYQPVLDGLAALEEEGPALAERTELFLRLAALCHPLIPVQMVAACAGVPQSDYDDFIEHCVDEAFGDDGLFHDASFGAAGFPDGTLLYSFRNSLLPSLILARLKHDRGALDYLANRLLQFLDQHAPPVTRALTDLRLRIVSHLNLDAERERTEHLLSWWIAQYQAEVLREHLVKGMDDGSFSPEFVWRLLALTRHRWPPFRRLALVEAYRRQPGGLPDDQRLAWYGAWCEVLHDSGADAEMVEAAEEALGSLQLGRLETAQFRNFAGIGQMQLGRFELAESHLKFVEEAFTEALGPDHAATLTSVNNLAMLYETQGRHGDALPLLNRALETCERVLGLDHPHTDTVRQNLRQLRDSIAKGAPLDAERK